MKRLPLTNPELSAFLVVFAIYAISVCLIGSVDAATGATKPRRNQKNSSSEPRGNPEILMISETGSKQDILVDVGDTVYMGCPLNRTNSYDCEWYKRGSHGGNKKRITQFVDRYHRITSCQVQIRSVTHDDEGYFICKAMTDSSEPTFHFNQLTVTGQDDPLGNVLPKQRANNSKAPVTYAEPEIAKESFTEDRFYRVHKGDTIQLKCEATGNPKPLVSWRRGSKNYTSLTEGYSFLKLTNLTTDDSGVYKCEAVNIFGKVVHEITLDVRGALQGTSEIIDVTPRNVTLYEGNQGNVTCIARFEGDPWFVWVKKIENKTPEINAFSYQGQYYSVLERTEIRPLGQQLYATTLLLQNVTVQSSGVYHCIVAGLQGYNHSEAYVVVEKDPTHLHIAQVRKHKTVAVLGILSFVISGGLILLCIFRLHGCPNAAENKILSSQASSLPSDSSSSRKTQLPKKSPETLSTDCTNPRHEVFVPLVAHGSCSLNSQEPSLYYKECSSSCPTYNTYNSYDREFSIADSTCNSVFMDNLEAVRSSCSHNAESLDSEFCSQQSITSPRTQTSDYYTTNQLKVSSCRSPRSHPHHHHKHRHQHHHHLHHQVPSENYEQQAIHFHPQLHPLNQCCCTQEYCNCHTPSYDDYRRSSSNIYVSSDCESDCYSDRTKSPLQNPRHHHQHHHPLDGGHFHSYCFDDSGRQSRVASDRRKLNPSPNLAFYEQLRANPNTITIL